MRARLTALGFLLLLIGPGCDHSDRVTGIRSVQPSSVATVIEPCDLLGFAEENDLWGAKVLVSGVYATDHQSFAYLKGECSEEQTSVVELAQVPEPVPADLKIREIAVKKACRGKLFCAYTADVMIEGILIRDDKAEFGVIIHPTKYLEWKIHLEE